jgi:hypothetical protein
MERNADSGLESGTITWGQDVVLLCQAIPKQDAILSGCREGVAGPLPLEWVAPYAIGAKGKAFPTKSNLSYGPGGRCSLFKKGYCAFVIPADTISLVSIVRRKPPLLFTTSSIYA